MAEKSDGQLSQSYIIRRAKEILNKSEAYLLRVLDGKTKLPERVVAQIALELYKRRIPTMTEGKAGNNQLTVVKVVKNYTPSGAGETEILRAPADEDDVIDSVISSADEKIQQINDRLRKTKKELYKVKLDEKD